MRHHRGAQRAWGGLLVALSLLFAISLVLGLSVSPLQADTPDPAKAGEGYMPGQVVVRAQPGAAQKVVSQAEKSGYKVLARVAELDLVTLQVPEGQERMVIEKLQATADVKYAELNFVARETAPLLKGGAAESNTGSPGSLYNDPYTYAQWNMGAVGGWDALSRAQGNAVIVATIGTGVDINNPELSSRLIPGYDLVAGGPVTFDDHSFGTINAGLIAATANNGIGIVGVAPEASLLPIRAIIRNGDILELTHTHVVQAINLALERGARVIHIEAAWSAPSQQVADAVARARERGAVVVAPAHRMYPASIPGVIGVNALNPDDTRPDWTGSGAWVKLSAPAGPGGEKMLLSTWPAGSCPLPVCTIAQGQTHFASAHVAGVAALALSAHSSWTPAEVEAALTGSALDLGSPGWDGNFGYGKVNAAAALGVDAPTPPPPPATSTPIVQPTAQLTPEPMPTSACETGKVEGCIGNNGRLIIYTFIDVNGNRFRDVSDFPLPGATVQLLDLNGNPIPGIAQQQTVLSPNGRESFAQFLGLDSGRYYRVRVTPPPGYLATLTTEYIVEPSSFAFCCTVTINFPFFPQAPLVTPTRTTTLPAVTPFGGTSTPTATGTVPTRTLTPTATRTVVATPTPLPSPTPTLPFNKPGGRIQIPAINYPRPGPGQSVEPWISVQNVGSAPSKAILFLWGEYSGFCEPQAPGPIKVECSGLLFPGSAWQWRGASLPATAVGGIAYSVSADEADEACDAARQAVGSQFNWWRWERDWWSHRWGFGDPLAVSVNRRFTEPNGASYASAYTGISELMEGTSDVRFGGYMFYAPINYVGYNGCTSEMIIQNSGTECTSIEIWYKEQDNCLRAQIDDVMQLAPGESVVVRPPANLGPGWLGSAWIRASQPLGIVVDTRCENGVTRTLQSYSGFPAETYDTLHTTYTPGSMIAYAPLTYREEYGWETFVHVQNLSSVTNAKVKVYFYDNVGGIIRTMIDWVCPRGSQTFSLSAINTLPGQYVGAVEIQSQDWWSPGDPPVSAPYIVGVVELVNRATGQAVSYNALTGGAEALAIPLTLKQKTLNVGGQSFTWNTEIALKNLNINPGTTNVRIDFYDQNGYLTSVCQALNEKFVDYIRLADIGVLPPGYSGSAVITATCSDQEGGAQLGAIVIERASVLGGPPIPQDLFKAYEAFPIHAGWYKPPVQIGACPGCESAACPNGTVYFKVCGPDASIGYSIYRDAPITIRNKSGQVVFTGFLDNSGRAVVGGLPTGQTYTVEVTPVNRPVPFPNGTVDQIQMAGFVNSVLVPCQSFENNTVNVDLTAPTGVVQGYVLAACGNPNLVRRDRTVQLWLPPTTSNPGGTLLAERVTSTEGYFIFSNLNPCLVYEVKMVTGALTSVSTGVIAGASLIQSGANAGLSQLYYLSDATGAICDVQPDPP